MASQNAYVLKILTGAQVGVEASIAEAEYVLGSGSDDDLHFVDLSLKPGHARLKIEDGTISVAGGAGGVNTKSGINILTGDEEWRSIEPLDIVTIGTTSFAIGPVSADWSSLVNQEAVPETKQPIKAPKTPKQSSWGAGRFMTFTALTFVTLLSIGWLASSSVGDADASVTVDGRSELALVNAALEPFPFSRNVAINQEVDGVVLATGYVETPAERRALRNAIDDTAVPVRFRVFSRDVITSEINGIIENQQIPVQFALDTKGTLTIRGDVLEQGRVTRLTNAIDGVVPGVEKIDLRVKTANSYLDDVRALVARSELQDSVILRLDGTLIEANGVIVATKVDNWVGFIQSYARRYADKIALRSFVQLVDENGNVLSNPVAAQPGLPIIIGSLSGSGTSEARPENSSFDAALVGETTLLEVPASADATLNGTTSNTQTQVPTSDDAPQTTSQDTTDNTPSTTVEGTSSTRSQAAGITLNLNRLKEGSFGAEDVFPGFNVATLTRSANTSSTTARPSQPSELTVPDLDNVTPVKATNVTETAALPTSRLLNRASRPESIRGSQALQRMTQAVLAGEGQAEDLPSQINFEDAANTLDQLKYLWGQSTDRTAIENQYFAMLSQPQLDRTECWHNSVATNANVANILFWLDYLSISEDFDLSVIGMDAQVLLLEAALNPNRIHACAQHVSANGSVDISSMSLYLNEVLTNPEFIRFIVRQLDAYQLNLSGVSTGSRNRYAQSANGIRFNEGTSPTPSSLLVNVGELGLLVQDSDRLSVTVYDASLHWKSGG